MVNDSSACNFATLLSMLANVIAVEEVVVAGITCTEKPSSTFLLDNDTTLEEVVVAVDNYNIIEAEGEAALAFCSAPDSVNVCDSDTTHMDDFEGEGTVSTVTKRDKVQRKRSAAGGEKGWKEKKYKCMLKCNWR